MIDTVTSAFIATIHAATEDLGRWLSARTLSGADGPMPDRGGVVALVGIAPEAQLRMGFDRGAAAMAVRLTYLVTVLGDAHEAHARLGRVAAALEASPVLDLPGSPRVLLRAATLEDLHHVWTMLGTPGRAALVYEVGPVSLGKAGKPL